MILLGVFLGDSPNKKTKNKPTAKIPKGNKQ
jgi:hypothetical protein